MSVNVRNAEQALAYLVDCTLATVCDLATKKSASKSELSRQISIAQKGIDWMVQFGVECTSTRAGDVKRFGSVLAWAEHWTARAAMRYSNNMVGFTSGTKSCFVFDQTSESSNAPNHVYTRFKASENAVSSLATGDSQVMVVTIDGEWLVVTRDEAKALRLSETSLKVVDRNTPSARWIACE